MRISRREFMKYCTVAAGALGLTATDLLRIEEAVGKVGDPSALHVIWLPGQACTGCTMSLTNSVFYTTVDDIALNMINLDYSETLAAASGDRIVEWAIKQIGKQPMALVLEGAIPHGDHHEEEFCTVWTRTGGIVAAGSVIASAGGVISEGTLVSNLTSTTLTPGDVIAKGSELVAGTSLPAGTIVESAADRAAMAAYGASFVTSSTSYGSDRTNTNVTLTAAFTISAGTVEITGGTNNSNTNGQTAVQGSVLSSNGTSLSAGTIVSSSFDRLWLSNEINNWGDTTSPPDNAYPAATFGYDDANACWRLTKTVSLLKDRAVAGPMSIAAGSTIGSGSKLKAGTQVTNPAVRSALISLTGIATLFNYGTPSAAVYSLAGTLSLTGSQEVILNGNVTLPPLSGGTLGWTPAADKSMYHEAKLFGTSAAAILCVGTCSSFGGIPAAKGNRTKASGVLYKGLSKPGKFNGAFPEFAGKTINIPGCPPHPDWIVGTIAYLIQTNYQIPELEAYGRPMAYYGAYQCNAGPCEWRYNQGYTDEANYPIPKDKETAPGGQKVPASNNVVNSSKLYKYKFGQSTAGTRYVGCIGVLGCKGRKTKADCSLRRWNGLNSLASGDPFYGVNWCVASGAGCHGCTEPTFPDKVGKFFNFA